MLSLFRKFDSFIAQVGWVSGRQGSCSYFFSVISVYLAPGHISCTLCKPCFEYRSITFFMATISILQMGNCGRETSAKTDNFHWFGVPQWVDIYSETSEIWFFVGAFIGANECTALIPFSCTSPLFCSWSEDVLLHLGFTVQNHLLRVVPLKKYI